MVRLSALHISRLYPQGNISGTHVCSRLSQPQGHNATGRIMSIKNSNDTIRNRTRDIPAFSAVPQQTAPARTSVTRRGYVQITLLFSHLQCPYFHQHFIHFVNKTVLETDVFTTCPNSSKKYKSQSKYEPTEGRKFSVRFVNHLY
jgi:hypothetical protein